MSEEKRTHEPCVPTGVNENPRLSNVGNDETYAPKPDRKSLRLDCHDYSDGDYFVTVCTRDKEHYFGKIRNGEMILTEIGRYCRKQLEDVSEHYPYATIIQYVVMPNHIHSIIRIMNGRPDSENRTPDLSVPMVRTALSVVVGGLKRAVTMYARRRNIDFGWQSRYHDHIVRGMLDGNNIAQYIENNVSNWKTDCFNKMRQEENA